MVLLSFNSKNNEKEPDIFTDAVNQAKKEYPKTTDNEPDIYQQNIIKQFSNKLIRNRNATLEKLNGLSLDRKDAKNFMEAFNFEKIVESSKQKIMRFQVKWRDILKNASDEEKKAYRDNKLFIYQNKLSREASYPDVKIYHWSFIILAVLLESMANSFFFANASDVGILGGWFQALFISIINIGSALLIGIYVLPFKNHVDPQKSVIAKVVASIYLCLIFLFNLASAHYRALLEEDPFNASKNAISHLIEHPLKIDNFEAWNLLLLGMLFVIAALIKGYKVDDAYPEYGNIDKKYKSAVNNHSEKREEAIKIINGVVDEYTSKVDNMVKNVGTIIRNYKNSILQSENTVSKFNESVGVEENRCNSRLFEYRDANTCIRDSDPPSYFSKKHTFSDKYLIPPIELTNDKTNCQEFELRFTEIEIEARRLKEELRKINEKEIEEITLYSKPEEDS